jgi:hypothetical protein
VFATATTAILVVMMMVMMPMIVGMIMSMVVVTAFRMVVTAPGLTTRLCLVTAALPTREQHKEKSGGEYENKNDERVHSDWRNQSDFRPGRQYCRARSQQRRFSGVTTRDSPAIVEP